MYKKLYQVVQLQNSGVCNYNITILNIQLVFDSCLWILSRINEPKCKQNLL